jgi:hypothetical protein
MQRLGATSVQGKAAAEEVLLEVGGGPWLAADCLVGAEIVPPAFSDLVRYWFDRFSSTEHPIYRALIKGWLLTSLVLIERAGKPIQPATDEQRSIIAEANNLSRAMPT